ncbi:hypothetical protein AB1Y20_004976 [Prymnesium parvum]|uniref:PH domain-containing protein n=1 Tax=Prymnesium parvum TaxID=97485 RepID=A0AB34J574_PRYPA
MPPPPQGRLRLWKPSSRPSSAERAHPGPAAAPTEAAPSAPHAAALPPSPPSEHTAASQAPRRALRLPPPPHALHSLHAPTAQVDEDELEHPDVQRVGRVRSWSRERTAGSPHVSAAELRRLTDALDAEAEPLDEAEAASGKVSLRASSSAPSSAPSADEAAERSGFLSKKSGVLSGLRRRFFVLREGTLLWFRTERDETPLGYAHLNACVILDPPSAAADDRLRGYPFTLRGHKDYVLVAADFADRVAWLRALRHNMHLPPLAGLDGAPSSRSERSPSGAAAAASSATLKRRTRLGQIALRAEDYMVTRAITSEVGKKVLREYCIPETFQLLDALRELVAKDAALPPKSGAQIENTILRVAVKLALLFQHKLLTARHFDQLVTLADSLCIDFVRKHDALRGSMQEDVYDPDHAHLAAQVLQLEDELVALLAERSSPKHLALIRNVTRYFGDRSNITRLTREEHFKNELAVLAGCLRGLYGLDQMSEEGFRLAARTGPQTFKVGTAGVAPGSAVLCKLPCCGTVIRIVVPKRTKNILFPPPQQCKQTCPLTGPGSEL